MTRSTTYSEKIIGGFQIVWGIFSIFISVYGLTNLYDVGGTYFHLTFEKISTWEILKTYHFEFILAILSSASGLLLILNKKLGWQFTIITSVVSAMNVAIALIYSYYRTGKLPFNNTTMILQAILITTFFLITLILLLKPFRIKYAPTKRTWWTMIIVTILLLLDNIIFVILK